jgi:predicted TIM-barrel fold metal-dependent hydrolase
MRGKPASVAALPKGMVPEIQRYYYDTAQSTHHPVTMSALKHLVGTSQILFGTDFPWGRAKVHADGLDGCDFSEDDRLKINRENAVQLLGTPGVSMRSGKAKAR